MLIISVRFIVFSRLLNLLRVSDFTRGAIQAMLCSKLRTELFLLEYSPHKASQNKTEKTQFSSISFQLWIIALAILAEITDRVLICWIVTSVTAVRILQDKTANLVSASRIVVILENKNANPFVYIICRHWIIMRKMGQKNVKCSWFKCPRCKNILA